MQAFARILLSMALTAAVTCVHAQDFTGMVTHVTDGDTLWVRPETGGAPRQVRLQGIDAPEICQAHGRAAREALAAQALHRAATVMPRGSDSFDRTLARVSVDGQDLGLWMVRQGHAWSPRFRRHRGPYEAAEQAARTARHGLWHDDAPLAPSEFRKRHGSCHSP